MKKIIPLALIFTLTSLFSAAQTVDTTASNVVEEGEMSLPEKNAQRLNLLENDFGKWGKLKISGYVQGQWQLAESKGVAAFGAGGSFGADIDNRFMIRRGRIKFTYSVGIVQVVIQPDFTEKGVGIKDAYIAVTSKSKIIGGQLGLFDRPFGYEISYSSSLRESPERSRVFLSLFPGERDCGAMLNLKYGEFTLNAGLFNGNGVGVETDSRKDFIGRVAWLKKMNSAQVGAQFSYYNGGVFNPAEKHYTFDAQQGFVAQVNQKTQQYMRQYFGVGALYLQQWAAGTTNLRAEMLWGNQPGTFKNNNSPSGTSFGAQSSEIFLRDFMGFYAILVQDIGQSKHSVVLKYDYYDPNTKVSGDQIGLLANTGAADIAYSTFGVGYLFRANSFLRLMAYYDFVDNEKSVNLASYGGRIKQNILTVRVQVKF